MGFLPHLLGRASQVSLTIILVCFGTSSISSAKPAAPATSPSTPGLNNYKRQPCASIDRPNSQPYPSITKGALVERQEPASHPVHRNEFAESLDSCLQQTSSPLKQRNLATKADLELLIQRQLELNAQIRALNSRVGNLLNPPEDTPTPPSLTSP